MAKNNNLTDFLTNLAEKFRSELGLSSKINPQNFESLIDDVYTKGYDDAPSGTDVSDTTASQSDVLSGKQFYNSSGSKVSGTMNDYSTSVIDRNPSTKAITDIVSNQWSTATGYGADVQFNLNFEGYVTPETKVTQAVYGLHPEVVKAGALIGGNGSDEGGYTYGTFTSDATAGSYDIYDGKTAYVNGQKVTGAYRFYDKSNQYNANATNCSTRTLKINCPFSPDGFCIVLNSATYTNNRVIAVWAYTGAIVYHTKTSTSVARTQITSGASSYWYYDSDNKQLVVNSPSTSYLWGTNNYRVFLFR